MPHRALFRTCAIVFVVGSLACTTTPSADWWTFQRDVRRTGFVRGGMGPNPKPYWQVGLVGGTTSLTPAVYGGIGDTLRIFIGSGYGDRRLFALSPYTGATLWTFTAAPNTGLFGAPAAADRNVYFATRGTAPAVYAVAQATGALVWQTPLPATGSNAAVAVENGLVFVNTDQHQLHALNQQTGAIVWSANTSPGATSQESAPSVARGRVYLASDDGLFAFNAITGAQIWKYNLSAIPGFSSAVIDTTTPALVFIGTNDMKLHAVDAATGTNVWTYTTAATNAFHSVAVGDGRVFVFDFMNVRALDRNTGAVIWTHAAGTVPRHAPAIAGRTLFFHDNANVTALNTATGVAGWHSLIPGNGDPNSPGAAMAIALETLLVPNKGHLHAFR